MFELANHVDGSVLVGGLDIAGEMIGFVLDMKIRDEKVDQ